MSTYAQDRILLHTTHILKRTGPRAYGQPVPLKYLFSRQTRALPNVVTVGPSMTEVQTCRTDSDPWTAKLYPDAEACSFFQVSSGWIILGGLRGLGGGQVVGPHRPGTVRYKLLLLRRVNTQYCCSNIPELN